MQTNGGANDVAVASTPTYLRELQPTQGRGHHGGRLLGHSVLSLGGAHWGRRSHGGRTVLRTVRAEYHDYLLIIIITFDCFRNKQAKRKNR